MVLRERVQRPGAGEAAATATRFTVRMLTLGASAIVTEDRAARAGSCGRAEEDRKEAAPDAIVMAEAMVCG